MCWYGAAARSTGLQRGGLGDIGYDRIISLDSAATTIRSPYAHTGVVPILARSDPNKYRRKPSTHARDGECPGGSRGVALSHYVPDLPRKSHCIPVERKPSLGSERDGISCAC